MKKITVSLIGIILIITAGRIDISRNKSADVEETGKLQKLSPDNAPQIPVIAWLGLPEYETTPIRYAELKNAGITHSYTPFSSIRTMQEGLNMAQKYGIKLFVSCPEIVTNTEATVKTFMNHPALGGYFLGDEPVRQAFPGLAALVKKIRAIDDRHLFYINLLPTYAAEEQLGTKTYQEYLNAFTGEVPVQILSFDHYPVTGDRMESIRSDWYDNLEMIAAQAKKVNKPFWAFALSVAFKPYPVATLSTLRLQVFSDLAYGAQGIQYFTYWTPNDPSIGFHGGPIDAKGKRTATYDKVKLINKEIKGISGIFLGARVVSISHTGDHIPSGAKPLVRLPKPVKSIKTEGNGAIVSVLKKSGKTYLVMVNRDFTRVMNLKIVFNVSGVSQVLKNSSVLPQKGGQHMLLVPPGDIVIYRWPDKLN